MKMLRTAALCAALALPMTQAFADTIAFETGATSASVNGQVKGYDTKIYTFAADQGQVLKVDLEAKNSSLYFNIYAPGKKPGEDKAMFDSSMENAPYSGILPEKGEYIVQIYLMRNAARRDEKAPYRLDVAVIPVAEQAAPEAKTNAMEAAAEADAAKAEAPFEAGAKPEVKPSDKSGTTPPAPRPAGLVSTKADNKSTLPCKPGTGKPTQSCVFSVSHIAGGAVLKVTFPDGTQRELRLSDEGNASTVGASPQPLEVVREEGLLTIISAPGERIEVPETLLRGE